MQALADLLRMALDRQVICREDLWTTEPEILQKMEADPICSGGWKRFCAYSSILRSYERPENGYWVSIGAKKRWIDPFFPGKGRVSQWDVGAREEIEAFQGLDFSAWLSAE